MVIPGSRWLIALTLPVIISATGISYAIDDKVPSNLPMQASALARTAGDTLAVRQSADKAIQVGAFDDAARAYVAGVLRSPNDPVLRLLTGVALSAVRKPDLAVQQFRQACRLTDDDLIASLLLQGALSQAGQTDAAQTIYLEATRRYGKPDGGLDSSISLNWLRNALKQTPKSPILYLLLGDAYQIAENTNAANVAYQKAIVLAPEWSKPKINLGLLLLSQNKPTEAVALFEAALRRDPDNVELMFFRADAQRQSGDLKGAIASYQRIETRAPVVKSPTVAAQALTGLGQTYAASGQYDQAVSALNRARTIAPADPAPSAALGDVQAKQKSFGDAAQNYANALRLTKASGLFGTQSVLYQALAQTQMADKQYRTALETLNRAMNDEPDSAALWYRLRGEVMLATSDQRGAEEAFKKSLDAQTDTSVFPYDTLTVIAKNNLLDEITALYKADFPGANGVGTASDANGTGAPAVIIRNSVGGGTASERENRAYAALAAIAQYKNDPYQEIALRESLARKRNRATDYYALAEAYGGRANNPAKAKDAYQKALNIGGLSDAQAERARLRVKQISNAKP